MCLEVNNKRVVSDVNRLIRFIGVSGAVFSHLDSVRFRLLLCSLVNALSSARALTRTAARARAHTHTPLLLSGTPAPFLSFFILFTLIYRYIFLHHVHHVVPADRRDENALSVRLFFLTERARAVRRKRPLKLCCC